VLIKLEVASRIKTPPRSVINRKFILLQLPLLTSFLMFVMNCMRGEQRGCGAIWRLLLRGIDYILMAR